MVRNLVAVERRVIPRVLQFVWKWRVEKRRERVGGCWCRKKVSWFS